MLDLKLSFRVLDTLDKLQNRRISSDNFFLICAKNHINATFAEELPQFQANVLFETSHCELHVL